MFNFKTKEERAEDLEAFENLVFPFGDEQKDFIQNFLCQVFEAYKDEIFYHYIVSKELIQKNKKGKGLESTLKQLEQLKMEEVERDFLLKLLYIDITSLDLNHLKQRWIEFINQ